MTTGDPAAVRRPPAAGPVRAAAACRLTVVCGLLAGVLTPRAARPAAEVVVVETSVGESTSAPPVIGYFVEEDPTLFDLSTTQTVLGPHGNHEDSLFTHRAIYRAEDRVNSTRRFSARAIPARGSVAAGHSLAVASGFADAGSNELGGGDLGNYAEASSGADGRSVATAESDTKIRYHVTIEPGTSGLAPGDPIEGLRWEFDADGSLEVHGRTFPATSAASVAAMFSATLSRQSGAICGPGAIVCPHGAVAAKAVLSFGAGLVDLTPPNPGDPTGRITSGVTWSAMRNTGTLRGGEVFKSGNSSDPDVGGVIVARDRDFGTSFAFSTGAPPLDLDWIDFNATVGETLTLEARLGVTAAVGGSGGNAEGSARVDFFHTARNRVFDPQQRGVGIVFEIEPLPTTGSTTTSTSTPTPTTTTTTLRQCGDVAACDDGDPCTVDACDPATTGCESRPLGAGDLEHQVPACRAQPVPAAVGRKLAQGCVRTASGLAAGSTKAARKQFAKALGAFAQGARAAGRAKRRLPADCADALRSFFAGARAHVAGLKRDAARRATAD